MRNHCCINNDILFVVDTREVRKNLVTTKLTDFSIKCMTFQKFNSERVDPYNSNQLIPVRNLAFSASYLMFGMQHNNCIDKNG